MMIPVLIEAAFRALLLALAVGAGMRLFRVNDVLAQKAAWGLVLAASVAMPIVMHWQFLPGSWSMLVPIPGMQQPLAALTSQREGFSAGTQHGHAADPAKFSMGGDRFPAPVISQSDLHAAVDRQVQAQPDLPPPAPVPLLVRLKSTLAELRQVDVLTIAAGLYLAVLACLLVRLVYGLVAAARMWQAAEPVSIGLFDEAEAVPALRLRSSSQVSSPVTLGSGVVLPADWMDWDADKLRIVLAHERSHVRQGDFYLHLMASLYAAAFWFSPLGWWLKRKLCDLGEAISDRAGLEQAASRAAYAQVLLQFAAMPRPTALGVAMARTGNLSHRIERLLNEARFRQAFAGGRRVLLAIVLVPVALVAVTAFIRVEAQTAPAVAPSPAVVPDPAATPVPAGESPSAPVQPISAGSDVAPRSPVAPASPQAAEANEKVEEDVQESANESVVLLDGRSKHFDSSSHGRGISFSFSSDGDSYALITDSSGRVTFSGDWNDGTRNTIDKARKLAKGKFLWFNRDGKSYFIDDQAVVAQIEAMYKPMEELGRRQEELGKQQEALGRQQKELGEKQEAAGIPTPDMSREIARLNEAVAKLNAKKGGTMSQEELADLQGKLGDIQGRLGELEGEVGARQGEFGAQQGKLGAEQGKLGAQQGRLGAEEGRLAQEADRKVKTIIDEGLRNGKARPVE